MNRKVNLVSNESQNLTGVENIQMSNLDSIFSYSCELLICKNFSLFDVSIAHRALDSLLEKLRPQGQLIVGVLNSRQLCLDYIHKKIDTGGFFSYIKNTYNYLDLDEMIRYLDSISNVVILETQYKDYYNYITITKTQP
jgi:hypothetical protein